MLRHLVVMKFADPADAEPAKAKLESLLGAVPAITSLRVDLASAGSPTGHHLALLTTHEGEAGLRDYQQHPAHVAVLDWLRDRLLDRAVVDTTE